MLVVHAISVNQESQRAIDDNEDDDDNDGGDGVCGGTKIKQQLYEYYYQEVVCR